MTKHRRHQKKASSSQAPESPRSARLWVMALLAAAVAVAVFVYGKPSRSLLAPAVPESADAPAVPTARAKPELQALKGRWRRSDGGYILEIRNVTEAGAMDAAYFNPRPIHVAKAEATPDGATIKVFVELRDVNYPGSTYTLAYEPASDQLRGIYYQAVQQQRFDVAFVRSR